MILRLYLQVKPLQGVRFGSELTESLQHLSPAFTSIDLDSHSEPFVVTKATEVIPKAEKLILHLDLVEDEPIGNIGTIFETLRRNQQPLLCIKKGNHVGINKILKLSGITSNEIASKASAIKLITDFLST